MPQRRRLAASESDLNSGMPEASKYRMVAAKAKYLEVRRRDLQVAAKKVCRRMVAPDDAGQKQVKRAARHGQNLPKVAVTTGADSEGERVISAYAHTDVPAAEYYALVPGAAEALGLAAAMRD